jgi:hypothetical protein
MFTAAFLSPLARVASTSVHSALPFFNEVRMLSFFSGRRARTGVKLLCALGAIAIGTACDDDATNPEAVRREGHTIDLRVARTTLAQDDTVTVVPAITDQETGDTLKPTYTYRSTAPTIASVGAATGLVRALLPGTTNIIASAFFNDSTYEDTVAITVNNTNRAATLAITTPDTTIFTGDTKTLVTALRNPNGTLLETRARTFTSLDTNIVRVSSAGLVTGRAVGTTRVILSAEGLADTISITVAQRPVADIVVTPDPANVNAGGTVQLTAQLLAANESVLTGRTVTWSSDNTAIATVNGSGLVTGVAGTPTGNPVTIRVTSEGVTRQVRVVVFPAP